MVTAVLFPQTAGTQVALLEVNPVPVTTTAREPLVAGAACAGKSPVTVAGGSPTVMVIVTTIGDPEPPVIVTVPVNDAPIAALLRTSLKKLIVMGVPNV